VHGATLLFVTLLEMNKQSTSNRRRLWQSSYQKGAHKERDEETFAVILQRFSSRPAPRSLWTLCSNALVVGQEFSLVCFLLARHRVTLGDEEIQLTGCAGTKPRLILIGVQECIDRSTFFILLSLLLVLFYSARSEGISMQQDRKTKVKQRLTNGFLLAILLRFVASILRTLTASYSSDTVQALAIAGMIVHVLACDYSYANGKQTAIAITGSTSTSLRPIFQGGSISLNAALFSTTMLVSRLSSNLTAYFFVTQAIVAFCFYPATRHAVAAAFHPSTSPALWLVTGGVVAATLVLLQQPRQIALVSLTLLMIFLVVPCWKYVLQHHKVLVRGPWDIPTVSKMKLDSTDD